MKLNEIIAQIRVELQKATIKKSGLNRHAGFNYYELSDFLPLLNELHDKHKVNDQFTIKDGLATLILRHNEESQEYSIPFEMFAVPTTKGGSPMMQQIQYLGALNTYYKRYLYLNAYGITDGEVIDSLDNTKLEKASLNPSSDKWSEAVNYMSNGGTIDKIKEKYTITEKVADQLMSEAIG